MGKKIYVCAQESLKKEYERKIKERQDDIKVTNSVTDTLSDADCMYLVLPIKEEMEASIEQAKKRNLPIIRMNERLVAIDWMQAILDDTFCIGKVVG